jgi:hypothetical protein
MRDPKIDASLWTDALDTIFGGKIDSVPDYYSLDMNEVYKRSVEFCLNSLGNVMARDRCRSILQTLHLFPEGRPLPINAVLTVARTVAKEAGDSKGSDWLKDWHDVLGSLETAGIIERVEKQSLGVATILLTCHRH